MSAHFAHRRRHGHRGRMTAWGHKVTLVVYVKGDEGRAHLAADYIEKRTEGLGTYVDFTGMSVTPVEHPPQDQSAS